MQDVLERFFAAESNVYLILQLKSGPETRNEQFESLDRLAQMGKKPDLMHYENAYFANTPAYLHGMDTAEALKNFICSSIFIVRLTLKDTAFRSVM